MHYQCKLPGLKRCDWIFDENLFNFRWTRRRHGA